MRKCKSGFTLVELLVVISIIALLLSILMPSLSRAKQQAQSIVCKSNLKGIGVGNSVYAENNRGRFVDTQGNTAGGIDFKYNLPPITGLTYYKYTWVIWRDSDNRFSNLGRLLPGDYVSFPSLFSSCGNLGLQGSNTILSYAQKNWKPKQKVFIRPWISGAYNLRDAEDGKGTALKMGSRRKSLAICDYTAGPGRHTKNHRNVLYTDASVKAILMPDVPGSIYTELVRDGDDELMKRKWEACDR